MDLLQDAWKIIDAALLAAQPDTAVRKALEQLPPIRGKLILVSVGKAAWQMALAAAQALEGRLTEGVVITKYGHSRGPISRLTIYEAGHPIPDDHTYRATQAAIQAVSGLNPEDLVLFLLSGGGSALFELPLIPPEELADLTRSLLACGADIVEMNTLRKRLSAVKGGKFAQLCAPARVFSVVLSDILGDPLDMIASGPACPDRSTAVQALSIVQKYSLGLSPLAMSLLAQETPKELPNAESHITGSVRQLCAAAADAARALGYAPVLLTDSLNCEAREAGRFFASIARCHAGEPRRLAFLAGGETVVHLTGSGKGGRNQELVLAASEGMEGLEGALLFSIGSDGTDGPTDAAGGWTDGRTAGLLAHAGLSIHDALRKNDAYHALRAVNRLLFTGPTGTNVNDLTVLLLCPQQPR